MNNLNTVLPNGTFGVAVSTINSNFSLIVSAINSLEYASTKSRGIYNYGFTPSTTTLPNAVKGDWCMVLGEGNTFPADIYTFNGTSWSKGGTWNPESIDLTQYAKTSDMNAAIAQAISQVEIETVDNLNEETAASGKALDAHQGFVLAGQIKGLKGDLDEVTDNLYSYESIDWTSQTTTLDYYINGSTGKWAAYSSSAKYVCRIVPITPNTEYRLTAQDDHPINYALLNNNNPAAHVGEVATDWNNGIPKGLSAGRSVVIDSGGYAFLYIRNNSNSSSTDTKYPKRIEKRQNVNDAIEVLKEATDALDVDIKENEKHILDVESKLYPYLDNISEVNYAFSVDKFGTSASYKHAAIPVNVGEVYIIEAPSDVSAYYCFATSNAATSGGSIPFIEGVTSATSIKAGTKVKVTIPDTCTYLLVYNSSNVRPFLIKKEAVLKKAQVKLGYDYIMATGDTAGDFGQNNNQFPTGLYLATVRFIKTSEVFACRFNYGGNLTVFFYDSEFNYIGYKGVTDIQANTDVVVTEERFKYSYIKFHYKTDVAFREVEAEIRGNLDNNWDVFNIRAATYHRICVMVNVSDARCSDGITSQIQDSIDLRPNYGVIALPVTYNNTGKPTRLIIYCHGAGTHFTFSNATGFNTREHVNPNYWLKEGYAVMDIDGNPMGKDSHAFRPQAMSAYIAAYKWAVEHYNLCRDGVLLGGRSMGAGTTMYLLRGTCPIPVIAACANHPTSVAMGKTTSAKSVNAELRGFTIPEGFTFSDGPMNDADTQVFYDNWVKSLRYVPSLALCVDTPTTEEWRKNFIKNCCHVGEPYESNRIAACKDLHMIVRAPLKMFGCFEDPNNGYQATAQLYMTMLGNAGQQAEYRLYHSDKATNYPSDSRTEHYYELADPTLRATVTTVYGEEVTNVPIVYVEMLQFWRRYEQNM